MGSLKSKGITAFLWDFLGKLSTQGMGFAVTIILARILEPSDFGLVAMIMVVIGIAQVFVDIGLGGALIQRRKVLPVHYSSVFYFNISIATILTCVTYFSSGFIAEFYDNPTLVLLIKIISFLFIINAFSSVQTIRLRKELNYGLLTKVNLISSVLSGFVGITLAFNEAGVWSIVGQVLSQGMFFNIIIWRVTDWYPGLNFSMKALKQLWAFGFKMFLSGLIQSVFSRMDFLIIGKTFDVVTLGYFQRAKQFNSLIIQHSSGSLMSVMFPILSQIQNDLPRFKTVVISTLNILCYVVFLLLGGTYLISEELIVFLFTDKWLPSVEYMELLLLSGFAYPISALLVNVLSSRGNSDAFLKLEIMKKALHVLNFINAYYNGIESYLYGLVLVSFASVFFNVIFVKKELGIKCLLLFKPILSQMTICIFSVVVTYEFYDYLDSNYLLGFVMKGSLFVSLYIFLNVIIKTRPSGEIFVLFHPMLKKIFR